MVGSGDAAAEVLLWDSYFEKLRHYVEKRARTYGVPRGMIDEESVTVSALESVFKCIRERRVELEDWKELSKLLFTMTRRKLIDHIRRAKSAARFPGVPPRSLSSAPVLAATVSFDMTEFEETLDHLLSLLPDDVHRQIAVLKLAGYTLAEIGEEIGRAVPTVNRKWRTIRGIWADALEQ